MKNKILGNLTETIPMNIQMYAEGGTIEGGASGGQEGNPAETGNSPNTDTGDFSEPTREELIEKLAAAETRATQAEADAKKLKNTIDKTSSEVSNLKKQLTAKMTAEEQLDAAKKEQEEAKDALIAEYQTKEKIRDCTEFLMDSGIGMDKKTAKEFAQKFVEGNFDDAMPILENHIKAIKDDAYQQALSSRPELKAGNGDADKNSSSMAMAAAYAKRQNGVNEDILKLY